MRFKKVVLIFLIVGLITGSYIYFTIYNMDHPDIENLEPNYKISGMALFSEFEKDASAASLKYNGKILEISGKVHEIERKDSVVIAIYQFKVGEYGYHGIRCVFNKKETEGVESLEDFRSFRIKGHCSGYNGTDVIIEKCFLTHF